MLYIQLKLELFLLNSVLYVISLYKSLYAGNVLNVLKYSMERTEYCMELPINGLPIHVQAYKPLEENAKKPERLQLLFRSGFPQLIIKVENNLSHCSTLH